MDSADGEGSGARQAPGVILNDAPRVAGAPPPPRRRSTQHDAPTMTDMRPDDLLRSLSRASIRPANSDGDLLLQAGTIIANKYKLTRPIGVGGMGSVWAATHLALETEVAIKFMATPAPEADDGSASASDEMPSVISRRRFEREAKASAQLRMANVVSVLDYGIEGSQPYLVMELLEGEDMRTRLKREGRMSVSELKEVVVPICRALQRAHEDGLIHRDLKPANIYLAREGEHEVPKILDFGLAKPLRGHDAEVEDETTEGTVVGTAYYASPEQVLGRTDLDHRSDLWSLGVLLFQAVTGMLPFRSRVLLEAVVEICSDPVPKASDIALDVPPDVDRFFERALTRDRDHRFQSATELAQAFAALGDDDEPSVAPARRKRPWLAAAIVGVALLGAAATWVLTSTPTSTTDATTRTNDLTQPATDENAPLAPTAAALDTSTAELGANDDAESEQPKQADTNLTGDGDTSPEPAHIAPKKKSNTAQTPTPMRQPPKPKTKSGANSKDDKPSRSHRRDLGY